MAHEHDVMLLPAPTDLSQLHGEGNDTTTRPGKGIRESFLLQHGGWTRRMEVQAGCICSPCLNVKREHIPPDVLAIPLNRAKLVIENFRYFSNPLTLLRASRNSSEKGN